MGFWSKLGKIGLKVAPYAAMAIPGIGPLASMAIQGGLGAAQGATGGGGWKGALLGGGLGAAGAKLGGLGTKGLGPSGGFLSTLGNVGKEAGKGLLREATSGGFQNTLGGLVGGREQPMDEGPMQRFPQPGGFARPERDMRNPNLSNPIEQGRAEGMARGRRQDRLRRQPTEY